MWQMLFDFIRDRKPYAVKLPAAAFIQHHTFKVEDLHQLLHELSRELRCTVQLKDGAAETIQTLDVLPTLYGFESPRLGLRGQTTHDQRCCQETEESDPVLRIG